MNRKILAGLGLLALMAIAAPHTSALENIGKDKDGSKESIENAAKRLYRGLANADMAAVFENTARRYENRKLTPDKVRPHPTGPKIEPNWDSNVKIVRSDAKTAVVEAKFFKPDGSDIPEAEVDRLRVYLVKEGGNWVAWAPKRKEARDDTGDGGWYHAGLFTFCPNRGIVFMPNHFSTEVDCTSVAACR
jgi:hypothetical protein